MQNHPLIELIRSTLDIIKGNWRYEAVFRCVKTELLFPEGQPKERLREQIDQLENYCIAYGIKGDRWTSITRCRCCPRVRPLLMIAVLMPMTSPRMFSSGPPELPGLIAASVCSNSFERPSVTGNGRFVALITPTLTVCARLNGLPIAITQSPGCICDESPNLASGSGVLGLSIELNQRAVGQRVAADHLRCSDVSSSA